jgi:1-acyl-sn-glycerol-3-phosphate acyltransferase
MDNRFSGTLTGILRLSRLSLHLTYGALLAVVYPHLNQSRQRRTMKAWNRKLLSILDIGIQIEGPQPTRSEGGCLIVANHVSWLDVLVLNAIHPARHIVKSVPGIRSLSGWLRRRCGTVFIANTMGQDSTAANLHISGILGQGASLIAFPESMPTDGRQVSHFHSALIQPAIDAGVRLCPIALRYQDEWGRASSSVALTGATTLPRSIWKILRCRHINALVVFTPALTTANENRRVLARAAQAAVAQGLHQVSVRRFRAVPQAPAALPQVTLSSQSAYSLLINTSYQHPYK